ncbi:MAG TPA: DUF6491 family protein [Stenotrophomonas sp.]|jgi:hypothetical protein
MRTMSCLALVSLLLAGCASTPSMTSEQRLDLYRRHAGAPIASFQQTRFVRRADWTPLDDQTLAVWTSPSRGHLLELRSRCAGLNFASNISITNSFGTVRARFDSVIPRAASSSPMGTSCRILRIRPLDGRSLRDEKRELREAEYIDRASDVQPDPPEATTDTP